jgi:II/X family phage/plasmid replication protein
MLTRLGIPTRVFDFVEYANNYDGCLIQALWQEGWKDIFGTFEGKDVNVYNDNEVLEKLEGEFFATTPTGKITHAKARRLFRFFRSIKNEGLQSVKDTSSETSFYRNMADLTAVVPKAYLQNLHSGSTNVVPLVKLINIDFSKQVPLGYVEPKSLAEQLTGHKLRLVG